GDVPPQALHLLGRLMADQHLNAEGVLRAAWEREPGNFWFNYSLGSNLYVQKRYAEGVGFLQTAAGLRPKLVVVQIDLGLCLTGPGVGGEAIKASPRASESDRSDFVAPLSLGVVLRSTGSPQEAVAVHRRTIQLAPRDPSAHFQLAYDLRVLG